MHESTVSRVTNEKYVQTPRGVLPLKFFFSSGLSTTGGEDVSARGIKDTIQKLVENEDPKSPLTDQAIVAILMDQGVNIARRTVAKYRDQLGVFVGPYAKARMTLEPDARGQRPEARGAESRVTSHESPRKTPVDVERVDRSVSPGPSTSPSSFPRRTRRKTCRASSSSPRRNSAPARSATKSSVIDDGSVDSTWKVLESLRASYPFLRLVRHRTRRGIADALRTGFHHSRGAVLVFYPADLQFLPEDIPRLVAPIVAGEADMVTGFKQGKYEKAFVSRVYNGLSRALFGIRVKDLNSVKAYRREVMEHIPVRPDWHRYLIVLAAAQGFSVRRFRSRCIRATPENPSSACRAFRSACSTCCPSGSSSGSRPSRCSSSACSAPSWCS
jgi:hypothetical protein